MRTRRETVEHPFGTIKMQMGATHLCWSPPLLLGLSVDKRATVCRRWAIRCPLGATCPAVFEPAGFPGAVQKLPAFQPASLAQSLRKPP